MKIILSVIHILAGIFWFGYALYNLLSSEITFEYFIFGGCFPAFLIILIGYSIYKQKNNILKTVLICYSFLCIASLIISLILFFREPRNLHIILLTLFLVEAVPLITVYYLYNQKRRERLTMDNEKEKAEYIKGFIFALVISALAYLVIKIFNL